MQAIIDFFNSAPVTAILSILMTLVVGYFASAPGTAWVRNNVPPGSKAQRILHRVHGLIDTIDPPSLQQAGETSTFRKTLGSLFVGFAFLGCGALTPTPSMPCAGLYCLEWSGHVVGLSGSVLICAKTELEAQQAARTLLERDPNSTVRKVTK